LLRSTLVVTVFTLAGQGVSFLVLVVAAALFGATTEMDAFLAAVTLPQYLTAVVLGALGAVFIPVFVQYRARLRDADAWRVASTVISLSCLALTAVALVGMLFAEPLLRLATPGLDVGVRRLAGAAAVAAWPMIVASGVFSLLSGIYQADGRFGPPAVAPLVGGTVNLGLLMVLVPRFGVVGLAASTTLGMTVQAVLLLPILRGPGRFRLRLEWRNPGVGEVFRLLVPLVLSGLVVRWTPVVERFLASGLEEGSIAILGYAFMLTTVLSRLLSTGISTVIFPLMAADAASPEAGALRRRMSLGLRTMFLAVAPVLTVGIALAPAVVTVLFRRGEFTASNVEALTPILRIYLLALIGMCLGTITGRGFYVLRDTRTLALFGVLEALAYAGYTAGLAALFGLPGIAWGYVVYFNVSLCWQVVVLRPRTGSLFDRKVMRSVTRTTGAAVLAGGVAWGTAGLVPHPAFQVILGGVAGLLTYGTLLRRLGSTELDLILNPIRDWLERRWARA
jgi:putative peptidoglycan lipid II flippase